MDRTRALEKTKASIFVGSNAAFLGTLLCGLTFRWDKEVGTAGVTQTTFSWNPEWFDSLTAEERKGVLLHELWHIALLHLSRMGERNQEKWNIACDLRINANLIEEGVQLPKGRLYEKYYEDPYWSEEKIYENLPDSSMQLQSWGTKLTNESSGDQAHQIALVQQAALSAKASGDLPGNVSSLLSEFLKPKLNWKQVLHQYLTEKKDADWSWQRPNRRFTDMYVPSLLEQDGGLTRIAMFLDVSGSISPVELQRFISEVKFVQEELQPEELLVIQFDTKITQVDRYNRETQFKDLTIKGYGGTSFKPVQEFILKHNPTISIIFTDLIAQQMGSVGKNEVIWIISSNLIPPFGKAFYVS